MYLTELNNEFLFDCKIRELSDKSIHNYEKQLNKFRHFVRENYNVIQFEELKPIHIKQYISSLQDRGCKPAYINDLLKVVKCLCGYAYKEGYCDELITKKIMNVKEPKTLIHTFSTKEISLMIRYFNGSDFLNVRNKTILMVFFDTGIRLSELINMQLDQIQPSCIIIYGKGRKERVVPKNPAVAKQLIKYLQVREKFFFNKAYYEEKYVFLSKTGKTLTNEAIRVFMKEAADGTLMLLNRKKTGMWLSTRRSRFQRLDVQSGKTSTYIGLMCKAADAGYRVFILLTGTIESLRQQTQQRVEEGFIGIDMTAEGNNRVGVGLDNKPIMARALTSRIQDFNTKVDKIAVSLGQTDAVVFVIKKQKNVLENLRNWLVMLNADPITKKIDVPMLLIDDEADNASVDTSKDRTDPKTINRLIRELANVFTKSNYVGFTATPYANVFIDPEKTEEMANQDLFPEDFIVALPTPSNYIGANKIFNPNGPYYNQLVFIRDAGCSEEDGFPFYFSHDKYWHDQLPDSLTDAIYTFYLANALRDLRGDKLAHRSMLINISRFIQVQKYIKEQVEEIHKHAYTAIKFNLSHDFNKSMSDPVLQRMYANWEKFYSGLEFTWDQVVEVLFESIEPIQIKVVNSSRGTEKLVYSDSKSLRVIAIGGLALSRGLTLEGLIVSYFFRNTSTYDVLMQMGRWFGYRKNFDDIFRIWTHQRSAEWYNEISDATDRLKQDMDVMRERKLKPKNFGIRVRNDSEELSITARNKMRSTMDEYEYTGYFGDLYETPYLKCDAQKNIDNFIGTKDFVDSVLKSGCKMELVQTKGAGSHHIIRNIPKQYILDFLPQISVSRRSARFDVMQIYNYLLNADDSSIDLWDVVFMDGAVENIIYI